MSERGKWEQLARDLAGVIREQKAVQVRAVELSGRRTMLEQKLQEELEQERAPLGSEVWQAEQDAAKLDLWASFPPAPEPQSNCGFRGCFYGVRGFEHSHGVD